MLIFCAWCGKVVGEKPPLDNDDITWTICTDCKVEVKSEIMVMSEEEARVLKQ
ncbi:hypothetical protein LCGC14_2520260 [marine sediment metagenome]|uniref:Uncharacterized protein n=1 Tax=marine sediment metagenome TaxID=412755 RepID=A0A0F9D851_9ZZZZ